MPKRKGPVYPVTAAFRLDVAALRSPGVREVGMSMSRMLKEYEHGTASLTDLAPGLTMKNASALLMEGLLHVDGEWSS